MTAAGLIVGGVFAYYKFFREDPYARRIQPTVSGSVARKDGTIYLRAVAQAKNYGQGTITLDNADTGLRVLVRKTGDADWTRFRSPGIFAEQEFLDSGETITEPVWLEISEVDLVALRLDLYVAESEAKGWLAREVVEWWSGAIISARLGWVMRTAQRAGGGLRWLPSVALVPCSRGRGRPRNGPRRSGSRKSRTGASARNSAGRSRLGSQSTAGRGANPGHFLCPFAALSGTVFLGGAK